MFLRTLLPAADHVPLCVHLTPGKSPGRSEPICGPHREQHRGGAVVLVDLRPTEIVLETHNYLRKFPFLLKYNATGMAIWRPCQGFRVAKRVSYLHWTSGVDTNGVQAK